MTKIYKTIANDLRSPVSISLIKLYPEMRVVGLFYKIGGLLSILIVLPCIHKQARFVKNYNVSEMFDGYIMSKNKKYIIDSVRENI